ncbi:MAG: hypothetical protein Q8M49_15315, partial [Limnobacter sp.]|nr:hypothetical protein [Limnobacter sp.]
CTLVGQGIGAAVVPAAVLMKGDRWLTARLLADAWTKHSLVVCALHDLVEARPAGRLLEHLAAAQGYQIS